MGTCKTCQHWVRRLKMGKCRSRKKRADVIRLLGAVSAGWTTTSSVDSCEHYNQRTEGENGK
jgi:hypothetical protein